MTRDLDRVGRELSDALDAHPPELDLARGRERLLRVASTRARRPWLAVLAAAAAVALSVLGWRLVPRSEGLGFRVGETQAVGRAGAWIDAKQAAVPLHFEDGTELVLREGARARVSAADASGASLIVERGLLHASVRHRPGARWNVAAGPFEVRVTGTEFEVGWEPTREEFSLALKQGSVVVSGPVVGSDRVVLASETLHVSCKKGELRVSRERAPAPSALGSVSPPPSAAEIAPESATAATRGAQHAPELGPLERLRRLARASEYAAAVAIAEEAGFDELCRTAGEDDLILLGDAARLAGRAERAGQAYRAVRDRFSGKGAARAGFMLGRLAFEGRADYAEAGRYFALSLLEEPAGPFSREAAGRLMESLERSGDSAGARAAATRYLEHYPDGPHASLAKTLVADP